MDDFDKSDIENEDLNEIIMNCEKTHTQIAKTSLHILKDKYVCALPSRKSKWYYFNDVLGIWQEDKYSIKLKQDLNTTVKYEFMKVRENLILSGNFSDDNVKKIRMLEKIELSLESNNFKNCVISELQCYCLDTNFLQKLDSKLNLIAFTNGVFDLDKKVFRKLEREDYLSMSVGYDYKEDVNIDVYNIVKSYWEQLHPNEIQRDYCVKMFAKQLYGNIGENKFYIHTGRQESIINAKTVFFEILKSSLGDYVDEVDIKFLTSKKYNYPEPLPGLNLLKNKRILFCKEQNVKQKLNCKTLRSITKGLSFDMIYNRENKYYYIMPQFKMHMIANDETSCKEIDERVRIRTKTIDYTSNCVDETTVELFRNNNVYKLEFLRYLLDNFDAKFKYDSRL